MDPATNAKPLFLLDTGPMISLCIFPARGPRAYIHTVLNHANIGVSDAMIDEIMRDPTHPVAPIVKPLLVDHQLTTMIAPPDPDILDVAYGGKLGAGERDTIRLGLAHRDAFTVIDDQDAVQIANRFGLMPLAFQDMLVMLARTYGLSKDTAIEMANATATRYPASFLVHTLLLLNEVP